MAVVKADAYGHGLVPAARAARRAARPGSASPSSTRRCAARGRVDTARVLSWLHVPGRPLRRRGRGRRRPRANATWALDEIAAAAGETGRTARVHLKIDTGLSRAGRVRGRVGGAGRPRARGAGRGRARARRHLVAPGLRGRPGHPTTDRQAAAFAGRRWTSRPPGLRPQVRHLANSAAALTRPDLHFDLVRPGLAVYGLSPVPDVGDPAAFGLRPAMTLAAGSRWSRGCRPAAGCPTATPTRPTGETTLGLVPVGYADGIPRAAGNVGPVLVAGRRRTVAGRVCMDQVVVDLRRRRRPRPATRSCCSATGDGEPTAQDWAEAVDTISYEIVTRIGPRVPRAYVGRVGSDR